MGETKVAQRPVKFDDSIRRSEGQITLFHNKNIVNTTPQLSDAVQVPGFRHFTLYLDIDSTSTPTTLQIEVQFLNEETGKWHTYKQGLFAALFYEDTDTASGIQEVFDGDCAGREFRLKLTGVGTTSSAYFTVTASAEFYN